MLIQQNFKANTRRIIIMITAIAKQKPQKLQVAATEKKIQPAERKIDTISNSEINSKPVDSIKLKKKAIYRIFKQK